MSLALFSARGKNLNSPRAGVEMGFKCRRRNLFCVVVFFSSIFSCPCVADWHRWFLLSPNLLCPRVFVQNDGRPERALSGLGRGGPGWIGRVWCVWTWSNLMVGGWGL